MHQRSSLSLFNLLRRYPFLQSTKPTSFLFKLLSLISTHSKSPNSSKPISNFSNSNHSTILISHLRRYSGDAADDFDKLKIIDEINLKFAEAREEIEAAMESKETVYFNEEAECARVAVKEVLDMFDGLLGKLQAKDKEALQRSMGLKMEQLKAELQQLDD
ncbi:embryogenesis-like protein [Amaranthus tricolor]|uniref:embryogenesis-like protein n=1 Tax=Amaranthus tricolor TaxID=29722 RepID=UPI002588A663|nr:embryogenesis-like protein [Amaranthus tricolor]